MNLTHNKLIFALNFVLLALVSCQNQPYAATAEKVWHENLPNCPCENPDKNGVKTNDGWAKDRGDITKYHPGATECFRSYPSMHTSEGQSGQQCCYDSAGNLITDGAAAGTPDMVSTCDGEDNLGVMALKLSGVWGHYNKDVKPWEKYGWERYNSIWKPNKGNKCPSNSVNTSHK